MNLSIISQTGSILSLDSFLSVNLKTEDGVLTILPDHEPLLSALVPGIMELQYTQDGVSVTKSFVTGGGVVNISPHEVSILADLVDSEDSLTDLEYIEAQKQEAARLVEIYKDDEKIDLDRLMAIEKDLMRYTLMHELGKKYNNK